jgi:hypothetical protein
MKFKKSKMEKMNNRSPIFHDPQAELKYCISNGFYNFSRCPCCDFKNRLEEDKGYVNGLRLRCLNIKYRKTSQLFNGLEISTPKISLNEYLYVLYSCVEKNYIYNIVGI